MYWMIRKWTFLSLPALVMLAVVSLALTGCAESGSGPAMQEMSSAAPAPQAIPAGVSCGKCGMHPAKYPRWQSQVIFSDGGMTPFDGCKCMFGFLFDMARYDQRHSRDQVAAVWVKDFKTGEWLAAEDAHYVVGSKEMGPMGLELIPFKSHRDAMALQSEKGGAMKSYDSITMATLKPLMGGGHMNMGGQGGMQMEGHGGM